MDTNAQVELEIRSRILELMGTTVRRRELLRELNGFAAQIQYPQHDYDSATHYDELFCEVAEAGEFSFRGHRPYYPETFWIPSARVC